MMERLQQIVNTKSDKPVILAAKPLEKTASEFGLQVIEFEGKPTIILPEDIKITSIEEEQNQFESFYDKENGLVYHSQPAIPLPLKVIDYEGKKAVQVLPLTNKYGIIHERGIINFQRNIRFFLMEATQCALHYTETKQQIIHPEE